MKDNELDIKLRRKLGCNVLTAWFYKWILRPGFEFWFDVKHLQLCKTIDLKYLKEIFDIRYKIENYIMTKPSIRSKMEL